MNSPEYRAFIDAVEDGETEDVERHLMDRPHFLDLADSHGWTPLHCAAIEGKDATIELLLRWGSTSTDSITNDGSTPAYFAACNGTFTTIRIFRAIGATHTGPAPHFSNQFLMRKLQEALPEDEIAEIRFRIYFSRSLLSRLLF